MRPLSPPQQPATPSPESPSTAQPGRRPLEHLMEQYLQGDVGAFEQIYRETFPRVRAWLRKKMKRTEKVEEVAQQIYLKFHQSRHLYRTGEVVEAWLFSIVRSTWIDHLRKETRQSDTSSPVALEDAPPSALVAKSPEPLTEASGLPSLEEQLAALQTIHREAIDLRYQAGESFESLARKWKVSEASARQRVSRAVRALREIRTSPQTNKGDPV